MPDMSTIDPSILYTMLKGEPGTRKSTVALTYPSPQYWFSWDRKMGSMMLPMKKFGIDPKNIKYDDYEDWNKPKAKLEQFQTDCPFKTLVFDSITSCADMTLRQTVKMKYGQKRSSGAQAGKLVGGIAVNEIEDYNAESAALQELIALTKDIQSYHKVQIIIIAHVVAAEYRNTTTNETHISRTIVTAGKRVAAKIPAYCSEVYHFNIDKGFDASQGGQYSLLTEHTGDDFARTGLPLDKKIIFGNKNLYGEYILPAINKLKSMNTEQAVTF